MRTIILTPIGDGMVRADYGYGTTILFLPALVGLLGGSPLGRRILTGDSRWL